MTNIVKIPTRFADKATIPERLREMARDAENNPELYAYFVAVIASDDLAIARGFIGGSPPILHVLGMAEFLKAQAIYAQQER